MFASGIRSELEPGVPDGMKCDSAGNIWVTAPGGVWVYGKNGALLGKVRVPELVANLHWGKAGLAHIVHDRNAFGLWRAHQDRPAGRAVHARERRRTPARSASAGYALRRRADAPSAPAAGKA